MKNVSDGINNFSQQLTRRIKTPNRGTYEQVSSVDDDYEPITPLKQIPTVKSKALQRDILDLQKDKFEQNLNAALNEDKAIKAASKLQDTIRRKLPLNTSTQKMQNDMLFMKKRMKKLKDDIDNYSATDIQRTFRGYKTRKAQKLKKISNAVTEDMQNQIRKQQERYIDAGKKIQKVVRGHKVRKQLPEIIEDYDRQQLINKVDKVEQRVNKMNDAAIKIQSAARNRKALKELYRREDKRDQYKNLINSGEIQEAFNRRENRRIKATTIQSSIRNKRARNEIEAASHNFNPEGYQELLRKNLKASQSQISHIDTRSNLHQSSKYKIIKQANERISRIDNLITKKSKSGRTRTRSGTTTTQEPVATGTGRLSMLSTTSTQAAMTPKKK